MKGYIVLVSRLVYLETLLPDPKMMGEWGIRECCWTDLSSPWSNCMWCLASVGGVAYFLITLSSIRAEPLNREKQPGEQRTQPSTCSVAFCSQ